MSCSSTPRHVALANKEAARYSKIMKQKEGLHIYGSGGRMRKSIQAITICYESQRILEVGEARRFYISVVEGFISQLNANPEIRPFLQNYPTNINNVDIDIAFINQNHSHIDDGHVAFIFSANGIVYYDRFDSTEGKFVDLYEEPYEVAKSIVMGETQGDSPNIL